MRLTTSLRTPKVAAQALAAYAARSGYPKPLYPFPYNRYAWNDPVRDRVWWLGPERENPAYWRGKIIFRSDQIGDASLFIGLYIEKGIDLDACTFLPSNRREQYWLMDANWVWHSFFAAMKAGQLDSQFRTAEERAGLPLLVIVDASRPFDRTVGSEVVAFECQNGRLEFVSALYKGGPAGLLTHFQRTTTLTGLATDIAKIPDFPCTWVDFQVGFPFWSSAGKGTTPQWEEREIWANAVEPLRIWLR